MREPQQLKGPWGFSPVCVWLFRAAIGPLERHQPRLVRVNRQSILGKPLGENRQDATGVRLMGESHDKVVRVADQERLPLQARLDLVLEPFVQHLVQEQIRKRGADHPTLRVAGLGMRDASVF